MNVSLAGFALASAMRAGFPSPIAAGLKQTWNKFGFQKSGALLESFEKLKLLLQAVTDWDECGRTGECAMLKMAWTVRGEPLAPGAGSGCGSICTR
ncbi:hypothetical protein LI328DRAFT_162341 [Trichoderma asperelloides]|nr:hypothetical protein LI328DRAFT_162341 [Trichoderma asperelloides]